MNKKILLTTAVLVGTLNATALAADPFTDVPRGHWAYDAIEQLAEKGIISGYGDNTFRGDNVVTRYEMAQMIAQALKNVETNTVISTQPVQTQPIQLNQQPSTSSNSSNSDAQYQQLQSQIQQLQSQVQQLQSQRNNQTATLSKADRAMLDKLASEFAEELEGMNVRVSRLEQKMSKLNWTGEVRFTFTDDKVKVTGGDQKDVSKALQLRLFPTATINENWTMKARLTASTNLRTDNSGNVTGNYYFVEGDYDKFKVSLGKMPLFSTNDDGLIADDFFSGAQVEIGNKVKAVLEAGKWDAGDFAADPANYYGIQLNYDADKFFAGVGYRAFESNNLGARVDGYDNPKDDKAQVISLGAKYKFSDDLGLAAAYAMNTKADDYDNSYNVQLNYKGATRQDKGTWGAYAAYRRVVPAVNFATTYPTMVDNDRKGFELGASYTPMNYVIADVSYFFGDTVTTGQDVKTLYGRVRFFF